MALCPCWAVQDAAGSQVYASLYFEQLQEKLVAAVFLQVPDWTKDNAAGRKILQHHGLEVFEAPIHLEGGSIHTDGEG